MTAPALSVHLGEAGVATPASDPSSIVWTAVTDDLELGEATVDITWGRQDEIAQADPNSCTLTLAAAEFRADAEGPRAILAESGEALVIGQALRVRGQVNGYPSRQRFFGYVSAVTPLWPDGDVDHLRVQVQAMSRLGWLARARNFQDTSSVAILAAGATSYWPMTETLQVLDGITDHTPPWFEFDQQSSMVAVGQNFDTSVNAVFAWDAFEQWGPSPDGLKVANFEIVPQGGPEEDSTNLAAQVTIPPIGDAEPWSATLIARTGRGGRTVARKFIPFAFRGRDDIAFPTVEFSQGYIQMAWFATTPGFSPYWSIAAAQPGSTSADDVAIGEFQEIRDRRWHLYTLTSDGDPSTPTLTAYRDAEKVAQVTMTGPGFDLNSVAVGQMSYVPREDSEGNALYANDPRYEFGRFAIYPTELSGAEVAQLYTDTVSAPLGLESTVPARLERWFTLAGFDADDLDVDGAGPAELLTQEVAGASPLALMQDVAATDGGILFDDPASTLTRYYGQLERLSAMPSVTLDVAAQDIEASFSAPVDLSTVVNSVSVRAANDAAAVSRTDSASVDRYGISGEEVTMLTDSRSLLLARADWRIYAASTPRARAPGLSAQVAALPEIQQEAVLGLGMWSVVTLGGLIEEMDGIPSNFFVEGGSESWGYHSVAVTLNVTDASPELAVGQWDLGVFDTAIFG